MTQKTSKMTETLAHVGLSSESAQRETFNEYLYIIYIILVTNVNYQICNEQISLNSLSHNHSIGVLRACA